MTSNFQLKIEEMPKKIGQDKIQEILDWLSQHKIDISYAKLHRHFSNGVALATLLKDLYPRLVEMHNYPAQNSIRLKLQNLETLNAKVLLKIGLPQKTSTLESIANGTEGAIERLLSSIMFLEQEELRRKETVMSNEDDLKNILLQDDQVLEIHVNKKIGDALVKVPQQMVLYSLYERTVYKAEKKREQLKELELRLQQAENDLELRRREVEALIKHEEAREYRRQKNTNNRSTSGSDRKELETESQKSPRGIKKSPRFDRAKVSPKNSPSSKHSARSKISAILSRKNFENSAKNSPSLKDDAKSKVPMDPPRKGFETSSILSRKERRQAQVPVHTANTK